MADAETSAPTPALSPAPAPVPAAPAPAPAPKAAEAPTTPQKVALADWIKREFHNTKVAGLLGGFQHEETQNGRLRDTPDAYAARLALFADRPAHLNEV